MKIKTNDPIVSNRVKINYSIKRFWDDTTEGWRMIWGPHIHHGYYGDDPKQNPISAQEKLIALLAEMLAINPQDKILDVGCGMGGSSLYLARNYAASVSGITLSAKQVEIAQSLAKKNKILTVDFRVEDAHVLTSFADNTFDVVWSLESCEQFYDKNLFIQQVHRVLKPGGKLMLATWCSDREEFDGRSPKNIKNFVLLLIYLTCLRLIIIVVCWKANILQFLQCTIGQKK